MGNLTETLLAATSRDRAALRLDNAVFSYRELDMMVARAAGALRASGVAPGDRVGLQLPNVPAYPVLFLAVLRLGGIVVPMNPLLKAGEVGHQLADSGARLTVAWSDCAEAAHAASDAIGAASIVLDTVRFEGLLDEAEPVDRVAECADEDIAVIIYTSGTTGAPKGVALTHGNLTAVTQAAFELLGIGSESVTLATLPLFHIFGMVYMTVTFRAGGLLTLVPRFDAGQVLEVIQRDGVTTLPAVPAIYEALLHHPDRERFDVSSLQICVSGGAPLPVDTLHRFEEAFHVTVHEGYGLSETSSLVTFNRLDRPRKPGSIGVAVGGTKVKLVDEQDRAVRLGDPGEILVRSPFVMKGYWNRPEATAAAMQDGWFRTGDIATADEDGHLFIVDRKKDMIIRGGYNIYPREVEELLYAHSGVREAAVFGVPDVSLGEEVAAAVVLHDGSPLTAEELREYVKQRVAAYKYPRTIRIVEELPKSASGKILKRLIGRPEPARAAAGAAAEDLMVESLRGPDVVEGVQSYLEQRPPAFRALSSREPA